MLYFSVFKCTISTKYYRFSFILLLKIENICFFTGIPSLLFLQQFKQTSRIFQNVFLIMHKKTDRIFPACFFIIQSIWATLPCWFFRVYQTWQGLQYMQRQRSMQYCKDSSVVESPVQNLPYQYWSVP